MSDAVSTTTPTGTLNPPELGPSISTHIPALTSIQQAVDLVRALSRDNEERVKKNARILDAYNAAPPYDSAKLRAEGLAWKTNFSTKPLAQVVDRVVPQYVTAIRNLKYLTASALPDDQPDAARKTEIFRRLVTETVRSHPEWEDLLASIVQEMVLFGYCAVAWPWKTEWFPTFYSQDDFLAPVGTRHTASSATVLAFREHYLRHELLAHIADREAASAAGWRVDNVIKAINAAAPRDPRSATGDVTRATVELERELSVAASFVGSERVRVWHVFVAEVDGSVTHVAFEDYSGLELLWREKAFDSMDDVAAFFTFQHGTGKLHSSKGVGRELYNVARVLDRARCEMIDRLNLSGKMVLQAADNDLRRFRMSIFGNAVLLSNAFQYVPVKVDAGAESYFAVDRFLTQILEQVAGVPTLPQFERDRVTQAEATLFAQFEMGRRLPLMERFLVQFARMMTVIQRRLLSPLVRDPRAVALQQRLQAVLLPEEYEYLATQPTLTAVRDLDELQKLAVIELSREARGNPLYNQYELERRRVMAQFDAEFANAVLLPPNDPTQTREQSRQQELENLLLERGQPVPVSPRDDHLVHLAVLHDAFGRFVRQLVAGAAALEDPQQVAPAAAVAQALLSHAAEHVTAAENAGLSGEVKQFRDFFQKAEAELRDVLSSPATPAPEGAAGPGEETVPQGAGEPQLTV